jgi:hypothetical protein
MKQTKFKTIIAPIATLLESFNKDESISFEQIIETTIHVSETTRKLREGEYKDFTPLQSFKILRLLTDLNSFVDKRTQQDYPPIPLDNSEPSGEIA